MEKVTLSIFTAILLKTLLIEAKRFDIKTFNIFFSLLIYYLQLGSPEGDFHFEFSRRIWTVVIRFWPVMIEFHSQFYTLKFLLLNLYKRNGSRQNCLGVQKNEEKKKQNTRERKRIKEGRGWAMKILNVVHVIVRHYDPMNVGVLAKLKMKV